MRKEAMFYEKLENNKARCRLCAHNCVILEYKSGLCGVRRNEKGELFTYAYGEVVASQVDPIEKKPFYHFLPGSLAYSVATAGCNFRCGFCQNWQISQVTAGTGPPKGYALKPEGIVREAKKAGCMSISYTYTEPTIFFEYAYDTARIAKEKGLRNTFVTNGFMNKEALEAIGPYLDAANIDLKSSRDAFYKKHCSGRLQPVLDSIACMKKLGIWVEVTTLLIPGENDSREELKAIAGFIASLDKDIPWHISRFNPDYQFADYPATSLESLQIARETGHRCGLHHVYLGNVTEGTDTYCRHCGRLLIKRGYFAPEMIKMRGGKCPSCLSGVPGVWK